MGGGEGGGAVYPTFPGDRCAPKAAASQTDPTNPDSAHMLIMSAHAHASFPPPLDDQSEDNPPGAQRGAVCLSLR